MNAYAQAAATLPPVSQTSGIDWPLLLGILAVVGVVALIIWVKHRNPAATAAAATVVSADASHLGTVIVDEFAKLRAAFESKFAPAAVTITGVVGEPTPPAPAGKSGQAGVFTATVTGDPKVDLPALTAAYLG